MNLNPKRILRIGVLCGALATITACSDDTPEIEEEEDMGISEHASKAFSEAKTAAELSWESFTEYTREKKDQAAAFLEKQSERFDERFDDFEERADNIAAQSKDAYRNSLDKLKEQRADLEAQFEKLKNASGETWEETKEETKEKWNAFINNMQAFSERFKADSEPEE